MQTAVINETGAEIMYGSFTNVAGQTMTTGHAISVCTLAASVNGNNAVYCQDNNRHSFMGVVEEDTADTGTGRYIGYGFAQSTALHALGTHITVNLDDPVGPGEAASLGLNSAGLTTAFGPVVALETSSVNANVYVRAWVRAM